MSEDTGRDMQMTNSLSRLLNSPVGSPFYFKQVNKDAQNESILRFDRHFNPELATDSKYFSNMSAFLKCVEKNVETATEENMHNLCAKEFKQLRMRGFDNELMYHNVNKRFFQNELAYFKNESPY